MIDVSGKDIGFNVKFRPYFVVFHQGFFECVRDDGEPEVVLAYIIDSQRDAIYGDRTLWDDMCDVNPLG